MAKPSVDQLRTLGTIATDFRWNMSFATFPNAITPPSNTEINLRCTSSDIPHATPENGQKVTVRGLTILEPATFDYSGTITFTFYETVDNFMSLFMKSWRDATWDSNTGVASNKVDLQCTINLTRLDNQDNQIWLYTLIGAQLADPVFGDDLKSEKGMILPKMSIKYDRFTDASLI